MQTFELRWAPLIVCALVGCGASGPDGDNTSRADADQVRALHQYLTQYGYFPNDELARRYPAWRPIVAHVPPRSDVFDEHSVAALKALQRSAGLQPTGVLNPETQELLVRPRCGYPDGMPYVDPSDTTSNFSRWPTSWGSAPNLTWSIVGPTDELNYDVARASAATSASRWAAVTTLTLNELYNSTSADIVINFAVLGPGLVATANGPGAGPGGNITLNTNVTWSAASSTPSGSVDFESILTHEMGHALGLDHSLSPIEVMFPTLNAGEQRRALGLDDKVAVSTFYDTFPITSGLANDIGAGGTSSNEAVWVIGTAPIGTNGDYTIHKWNGSTWVASDGGARRVAVEPNGVPWVVNAAGKIFRRTSSSPTSGGWQEMPGLAHDIGIGANGAVWAIGTIAVGNNDFSIHQWNGAAWVVTTNGAGAIDGGAVKIAVGPAGVPWVVNSAGNVYRRTTSVPHLGTWEYLAGPAARDIGIYDRDYAWIVAEGALTDGFLHVWNDQEWQWVASSYGSAYHSVSVGPDARPWAIDGFNQILRSAK